MFVLRLGTHPICKYPSQVRCSTILATDTYTDYSKPVSVVVGIVVLVILWWIFSSLRKCLTRKKAKKNIVTASEIPPSVPAQRLQSWPPGIPIGGPVVAAGPFTVPPQRVQRNGSGSSGGSARADDSRRPNSLDRPGVARDNDWSALFLYHLKPHLSRFS